MDTIVAEVNKKSKSLGYNRTFHICRESIKDMRVNNAFIVEDYFVLIYDKVKKDNKVMASVEISTSNTSFRVLKDKIEVTQLLTQKDFIDYYYKKTERAAQYKFDKKCRKRKRLGR